MTVGGALLVAGERLFFARRSADGESGESWALSAAEGKVLSKTPLPAAPRWDGVAGVDGSLFVSTQVGRVLRLSAGD